MLAGRVILAGRALSVDDALSDPSYNHAFAQAGAWRRMAGAPMLKDGVPIGAILGRLAANPEQRRSARSTSSRPSPTRP